jgi:predicted negative regulator of RcsB-dependent stress response
MRHNHPMTRALTVIVALAAAACGGPGTKSTLPTVDTKPGDDLARAQVGANPADGSATDPRLGTAGAGGDAGKTYDLDTIRIGVVGTDAAGDAVLEATLPVQLLQEGTKLSEDGHLDAAIAKWRQLVTEFPESKYAAIALWDIAAVQEKQGDPDKEIATLRELVTSYPQRRESVDAHLYIAALQTERDQYKEAARTLDEVVVRTDLTYADRIEALARKGYVQIELGDTAAAKTALDDAIAVWKKAPRIADSYFVAMAHYYRGELVHRQFAASPIRKQGTTAELHDDLEARERLAAEAYDRWRETLDFQHAYWSTAAGYQMSQIFVEFWQATVTAPYPTDLGAKARPDYVTEVHARVKDHLEKALEGHRMNVELGAAFQVKTQWAEASKQRAAEIMTLMAQEAGGHYVTPAP